MLSGERGRGDVPIRCDDRVSEGIDLLRFRLLSHLGDRRSLLLFLEFAAHDCGVGGLILERLKLLVSVRKKFPESHKF